MKSKAIHFLPKEEVLSFINPGITFTIGDYATNDSFKNLIRNGIRSAVFNKQTDVAACMGGGFLGAEAVNIKRCFSSQHGS